MEDSCPRGVWPLVFSSLFVFAGCFFAGKRTMAASGDPGDEPRKPEAVLGVPDPRARVQEPEPLGEDVGLVFLRRLGDERAREWTMLAGFGDASLRVFSRRTPNESAWIGVARPWSPGLQLEARLPRAGAQALAPVSQTAEGCAVAVNAGYFGTSPRGSLSLVVKDTRILSIDARNLSRPRGLANPTRAALGWTPGTLPVMSWASVTNGILHAFAAPRDPFGPQSPGESWRVSSALGGGPMLVWGGQKRVTWEEEAFTDGISPAAPAPRTAVCRTSDDLILLAVLDGRRADAVGVTLVDLADFLMSLGCVDGLNFDGGGSTTFFAGGVVRNLPSDGRERSVSSVLCLGRL